MTADEWLTLLYAFILCFAGGFKGAELMDIDHANVTKPQYEVIGRYK